jgi:hypothetical protein
MSNPAREDNIQVICITVWELSTPGWSEEKINRWGYSLQVCMVQVLSDGFAGYTIQMFCM